MRVDGTLKGKKEDGNVGRGVGWSVGGGSQAKQKSDKVQGRLSSLLQAI